MFGKICVLILVGGLVSVVVLLYFVEGLFYARDYGVEFWFYVYYIIRG